MAVNGCHDQLVGENSHQLKEECKKNVFISLYNYSERHVKKKTYPHFVVNNCRFGRI